MCQNALNPERSPVFDGAVVYTEPAEPVPVSEGELPVPTTPAKKQAHWIGVDSFDQMREARANWADAQTVIAADVPPTPERVVALVDVQTALQHCCTQLREENPDYLSAFLALLEHEDAPEGKRSRVLAKSFKCKVAEVPTHLAALTAHPALQHFRAQLTP